MLDSLLAGATHIVALENLLFLCSGTALGIIFGALPGLTATMGLALLVPFTFSMAPASGLLMLAGIYVGAMYGDAIPAILINTPGTPAAIATTFDGYPLARKGRAQHALVAAAFASFFGSIFANVVLFVAAEPLAAWSLKFGPAEYFWLGIFGLTIISVLSSGKLLRGFITAVMGLLMSTVGMATLSGDVRLTFGFSELQGGIGLAGALIGFFCLPEILANVIGQQRETYTGGQVKPNLNVIFSTSFDLLKRPILMIRSSLIGLVVGMAPGAGGNIASMVSYSETTRWEKDRHEFGQGTTRGVAASEAANSAMAPGSLIPLLTLGIPGSPPAAVILGALMLHGMQPGNDLFAVYADATYAFMLGLAVAAFAVLVLGTLGSFVYARIVNIPSRALAPVILVMTVLGSYAIRNNMLDVWMMLLFGILGFILNRLGYHPAPLVLGLILGPYVEDGLVQSMMIGGASGNVLVYMIARPISLILIALCLMSALAPLLANRLKNQKNLKAEQRQKNRSGLNADLIMGGATLILAGVIYWNSQELSRFGGLFVHFCTILLALLSLILVIKGFFKPKKQALFGSPFERNRVAVGILILAGYLLSMPMLGFLISSFAFYFIMHSLLHENRKDLGGILRTLALSTVITASMYLLFRTLLNVPLPNGIWLS